MASTTMPAFRDIARPAMPPSPHRRFPADTPMLESLWNQAIACDTQPERDPNVVLSVRQLCEACRIEGLRAEHLVLAIKGHCAGRESAVGEERRSAERTLDSLVSLCIREFYRPESGDAASQPVA